MAAIELPKIPQDFQKILLHFFEQEVGDFAGNLAKTYEQKWTQQLKDAVAKNLFGRERALLTLGFLSALQTVA